MFTSSPSRADIPVSFHHMQQILSFEARKKNRKNTGIDFMNFHNYILIYTFKTSITFQRLGPNLVQPRKILEEKKKFQNWQKCSYRTKNKMFEKVS